jgi:hypothetical protein
MRFRSQNFYVPNILESKDNYIHVGSLLWSSWIWQMKNLMFELSLICYFTTIRLAWKLVKVGY